MGEQVMGMCSRQVMKTCAWKLRLCVRHWTVSTAAFDFSFLEASRLLKKPPKEGICYGLLNPITSIWNTDLSSLH